MESQLQGEDHGEGIPHMRLMGIWGRVVLAASDVTSFCRLYGYQYGGRVTSVRIYGGYLWDGYLSLDCLADDGKSRCNKKYP